MNFKEVYEAPSGIVNPMSTVGNGDISGIQTPGQDLTGGNT